MLSFGQLCNASNSSPLSIKKKASNIRRLVRPLPAFTTVILALCHAEERAALEKLEEHSQHQHPIQQVRNHHIIAQDRHRTHDPACRNIYQAPPICSWCTSRVSPSAISNYNTKKHTHTRQPFVTIAPNPPPHKTWAALTESGLSVGLTLEPSNKNRTDVGALP